MGDSSRDDDPANTLALRLLGEPAFVASARCVPIALQRGAALLALLATSMGALPREQLVALLWPDADAGVARARLRRLVYRLEALAGRALFDARADRIALRRDGLRIDLAEFQRAARAAVAGVAEPAGAALDAVEVWVAHAAQPLLDGVAFGSPTFDDWLHGQRQEQRHLLARLLSWLGGRRLEAGDPAAAGAVAQRLLALDPFDEPAHVLAMRAAAALGNAAGVEAAYLQCAEALRAEFGTRPGPQTEEAYVRLIDALRRPTGAAAANAPVPAIRFAETPGGTVAYATLGDAPEALVVIGGFVSHIEIGWEQPALRAFLTALARRFTVVLFDRRGVGLSERLGASGTVEAAAQDVRAILDAAGIDRAWLFGASEGGPIALRLAADQPGRTRGVMLFDALAKGARSDDHPWALRERDFDTWLDRLLAGWGGPAGIDTFAPTQQHDAALRAWWSRMLRHATSPQSLRIVLQGLRTVDVRPLLGRLAMPVLVMHRRGDRAVWFGAGEYLARGIPGARFVALEGDAHWWWCGDADAVRRAIVDFADTAREPGGGAASDGTAVRRVRAATRPPGRAS